MEFAELNLLGTAVVLLLTALSLFVGRSVYGDYTNPIALYAILWGAALFLVATRFSFELSPIDASAFVLFVVAFMAFVSGAALGCSMRSRAAVNAFSIVPPQLRTLRTSYWAVTLFSLVGSAWFLIATLRTYGVEEMLYRGFIVHDALLTGEKADTFPGGVWGYRLIQFLVHPAIYWSATLAGVLVVLSGRFRWRYLLPLLAAALFDAAIVGRFRVYSVIMIFLSAAIFRPRWAHASRQGISSRRTSRAATTLLVFLFGLAAAGLYAGLAVIRTYDAGSYQVYGAEVPGLIFEPIKYQLGGLYLFGVSKDEYGPVTLGTEMLYPLIKMLGFLGFGGASHEYILGTVKQIGPDQVMNGFHTYLFAPYRDFGVLGVVFIPLLLGGLAGFAYRRAMTFGAWYWLPAVMAISGLVILPSTIVWPLGDFGRALAVLMPLLFGVTKARAARPRTRGPYPQVTLDHQAISRSSV